MASEASLDRNSDRRSDQGLMILRQRLSRMQELKNAETERTGTVTTCIVAVLKNLSVKIALFFTGWRHVGENLDDLLEKRPLDSPKPIQQCDALSRNVPKNH